MNKNSIKDKFIQLLREPYYFLSKKSWLLRSNKSITKIFGPKYQIGHDLIQLDITYDCNVKCMNCNRSCRQAPSTEHITVDQIKKFVRESIDQGIKWKGIYVLGGEPTLHPNLLEILNVLLDYKHNHSNQTFIELVTNGAGPTVNKVLSNLPKEVIIRNTSKDKRKIPFFSFNIAPSDIKEYQKLDFSNGCSVLRDCGMGLTPFGYYPCGTAGGIDRVFGFDNGRKTLPPKDDKMTDLLHKYCRLCGRFKVEKPVSGQPMSKTWEQAYLKFKQNKPKLTKF